MRASSSFLAGILCCFAIFALAQQKPSALAPPSAQHQSTNPADGHAPSAPVPDKPEAQPLNADIARMRSLLRQMETNVAFVDTSQSPLKHQFQLEIDMWRLLLDDMEKKVPPPPAR